MAMIETSPLDAAMEEAISAQRSGRLEQAEQLYRDVLKLAAGHAVANHNLAVMIARRGEAEQSLPYFGAALRAEPGEGVYWLSYARGLLAAGRPAEARRLLDRAREFGF